MRVAFLTVFMIVLIAGIGWFVYLGLYPPPPHVHSVDRTIGNDQFQTR